MTPSPASTPPPGGQKEAPGRLNLAALYDRGDDLLATFKVEGFTAPSGPVRFPPFCREIADKLPPGSQASWKRGIWA
jgi:hypothetical protein